MVELVDSLFDAFVAPIWYLGTRGIARGGRTNFQRQPQLHVFHNVFDYILLDTALCTYTKNPRRDRANPATPDGNLQQQGPRDPATQRASSADVSGHIRPLTSVDGNPAGGKASSHHYTVLNLYLRPSNASMLLAVPTNSRSK